jgi:dihydrolipoamide dehydrogenase
MPKHDLVIIGAGPGGYVAAIRAAQLGLDVGVVDQRYAEANESLADHGITIKGINFDLKTALERKRQMVDALVKGIEGLFKKNKIKRYTGHARLAGRGQVVVEPGDGDDADGATKLEAERVIIATGSKPADLKGVQVDGDRIGTSTEALSYSEVPEHLVVIGAGYIGLELGSVWRRLGAKVTVLEFLDRILPGMDAELATETHKLLKRQGLEFHLGSRVTGARVKDHRCSVEREDAEPVECDRVLVAVGRVPNTDGLGLEAVGIELDKSGQIPVEARFATSVDGLYAIGDVIRGPMLAHKAEEEGIACVEGIVTGHGHVNYDAIPAVVYTQPEIATVGKTEDELKRDGVEYCKGVFHFRGNSRARVLGQVDGRVKILADAKTDRIRGVHIIGPHAGDLIAEAVAAIEFGASSEDLARCCHAHPTLAEALKEAALSVGSRCIHA